MTDRCVIIGATAVSRRWFGLYWRWQAARTGDPILVSGWAWTIDTAEAKAKAWVDG